jgi:cytochrome b561
MSAYVPKANLNNSEENFVNIRNSASQYGLAAMSLHWATVALIIVAWSLGTFGDEFPKGPARDTSLFVHIFAGLLILIILVLRVAWRIGDRQPLSEPTTLGPLGDGAGRIAHFVLYFLLAAVPIVGVVLQFARGAPVSVFGLFEFVSPWVADRTFSGSVKGVHEFLANALVVLAVFHAGAGIFHHWFLKDKTLIRMLPWAQSKS